MSEFLIWQMIVHIQTSVELHNLPLVPGPTYTIKVSWCITISDSNNSYTDLYPQVFPFDCTCGRRSGKWTFSIGVLLHSTTMFHSSELQLHTDNNIPLCPRQTATLPNSTTIPPQRSTTLPNFATLTPTKSISTSNQYHWLWFIFLVFAIVIFFLFLFISIAKCRPKGLSSNSLLIHYKKYPRVQILPHFLHPPTIDILLVYSLRTPTTEVEYILENFVQPLRLYRVRVLFYDTLYGRIGIPQWMENSVAQSSKVFLVCNSQFKKEWEDPSASQIEGNLVHLLKQNFFAHVKTSSDYMAKYALLFTKADQKAENCIASSYLQNLQRFLIDSEDPARLEHVAKFIRNCEAYTLTMED